MSMLSLAMAVATVVPANTTAPALSPTNIYTVGQTVTGDDGAFNPSATLGYVYQWQVSANGATGWADIAGAIATDFLITPTESGKYIRKGVKGTNAIGTTGAFTYSTPSLAIVAALNISGTPPTYAEVGDTLAFLPTVTGGRQAGAPGFSLFTGTLPAGASIHATNCLVGTVTTPGVTAGDDIVIRYTDADGLTVNLTQFDIEVVDVSATVYATLDPTNKGTDAVLSNGNLSYAITGDADAVQSNIEFSTGKKRFEVYFPPGTTRSCTLGVNDASWVLDGGFHGAVHSFGFGTSGAVGVSVSNTSDPTAANPLVTGEWWAVEFDADTGAIRVITPRGSYAGWNISSSVNTPPVAPFRFSVSNNTPGIVLTVNFGASAWNRAATSGYDGLSSVGGGGADPDAIPDDFSFGTLTGRALSSTVEFGPITLTGLTAAAAITGPSDCTYSLNGGAATASAGTYTPGDALRIFVESDAAYLTETEGHLTIGGITGIGTARTLADPADIPEAPLSITAPVVGLPLDDQWALQAPGATGPQTGHSATNGRWNTTYSELAVGTGVYPQRPNDPYLQSLGFYYNNYGDLWVPFAWIDPAGTVLLEDYDFDGGPDLSFWGDGASVVISNCENYNVNIGKDINRSSSLSHTMELQITYCDMDATRWDILCQGTLDLGPYNRIRNQLQELGFGGGYQVNGFIGIKFHHNYLTGGGCGAPDGAHIELWQHILNVAATGSYCWVEDNMMDFSKDGQRTTTSAAAWTGVLSEGGDSGLKFNRNIVKGIDIVNANPANPNRMGTVVAYADENVSSPTGFEMNDNAMSKTPVFGYTYKHGGGVLKPTVSGNRTFRDADSDTAIAGYAVPGPADNVAITLADIN